MGQIVHVSWSSYLHEVPDRQAWTISINPDQKKQNITSEQGLHHYENTPIQIYWKFYNQKMNIFR